MIKSKTRTFKSKILLGCSALMLIFIISLSFMLYTNKRNLKTINYITEQLVPVTVDLLEIQKDIKEIELHFYGASISEDSSNLIKVQSETSFILKKIFSTVNNLLTGNDLSYISDYFYASTMMYQKYIDEGILMTNAYINKGKSFGEIYKKSTFAPLSQQLQEEIDTIVEKVKNELNTQITHAQEIQSLSWNITLALIALSIILSVFISIRIANSLSKPISLIIKSTSKIAEGDLTYVPDYKKNDEIGKFSSNFKIAIDNLKKLIFEVKDASGNTVKISERVINSANRTSEDILNISDLLSTVEDQFKELSLSIGTTSESSEIISRNISSLTNQIEDQATAVTQTSTALEELSATINNVSVIASRNQKETQTLLETAEEGGERIDQTKTIVSDISKHASDMNEILEIINGIASQTNLLAMNASIEAAHAGEYGKGFAVVADEIMKLAESTSDNSNKISSLLTIIIDKIKTAESSSSESRDTFQNINEKMHRFINAFSEIAANMNEMSAGTGEITESSLNLSRITREIEDSALDTNKRTISIGQILQDLKSNERMTEEAIGKINTVTHKIKDSMDMLIEQTKNNDIFIKKLDNEINKFKLS